MKNMTAQEKGMKGRHQSTPLVQQERIQCTVPACSGTEMLTPCWPLLQIDPRLVNPFWKIWSEPTDPSGTTHVSGSSFCWSYLQLHCSLLPNVVPWDKWGGGYTNPIDLLLLCTRGWTEHPLLLVIMHYRCVVHYFLQNLPLQMRKECSKCQMNSFLLVCRYATLFPYKTSVHKLLSDSNAPPSPCSDVVCSTCWWKGLACLQKKE